MGDRWRTNKSAMEELAVQITDSESQFANFASADNDRLNASNSLAQLSERLESFRSKPEYGSRRASRPAG